jgi:phosphate transport system permease protein
MVIGKGYFITGSLFQPGTTAASQLAGEFHEAGTALHKAALVELALILMVITLLVNVLARLLVWRFASAPSLARE